MAARRRFNDTFKRMVVEEYLSGAATQAQLAHRYNLSSNLIPRWRKVYSAGKLTKDNIEDIPAMDARIRDLERMVGKLTMENEFLKKTVELKERKKKDFNRVPPSPNKGWLKGGAK